MSLDFLSVISRAGHCVSCTIDVLVPQANNNIAIEIAPMTKPVCLIVFMKTPLFQTIN